MIESKRILLLVIVLFTSLVNAQEPYYKSYDWKEKPEYNNLKVDTTEAIISFKDKKVSEFAFLKGDYLIEYYIQHKIFWLNSDDVIESYNKIYLPYGATSELVKSKARVITKDGEILELDNSKILTATNEENNRTYKYFALEGVEKGSFIEYYYIIKRAPEYRGKRIFLQSDMDKYDVAFDLISPNNLIFESKSYNGADEIELDTLVEGKRHWKIRMDTVPKLIKEKSAPYNTLKQHLIYKLDRNTYSGIYDITSYNKVSTNIYNYYYVELTKKELKSIKGLISKIGFGKSDTDAQKVKTLENYLKSNFYITESIDSETLKDIKLMIDRKTANESGIIKLFVNVLRELNINTEIVLTGDRYDSKFDVDFEANNFLTTTFLYFPSIDKFTSPTDLGSRLGFLPTEYTCNHGLFVKEVTVGTYKSGLGVIKEIPFSRASETVDHMQLNFKFDPEDFTHNFLDFEISNSGYQALYIQPYLKLIEGEKKAKILEAFIRAVDENIEIEETEVLNEDIADFGVKPLIIKAKSSSNAFVNKAGNKFLVNLGKLIGPQMEMYQEDERKTPYESNNTRTYKREITIEVPEGYEFTNLEDININNSFDQDGKTIMGFHSYYELKGNQLLVNADEFYDLVIVQPEIFEDYRKIINNAADFNKITLVLQKKK